MKLKPLLMIWTTIIPCVICLNQPSPPLTSVRVEVAENFANEAPFDTPHQLLVPEGFGVRVYARVHRVRSVLAVATGEAFVTRPSSGEVLLLKPSSNGSVNVATFISGLKNPHQMLLTKIEGKEYLYVSESDGVVRYEYKVVNGTSKIGSPDKVIQGLPDEVGVKNPFKGMAIGNGSLYISIGGPDENNPEDFKLEPKRGSIFAYPLNGGEGKLVAQGVRSALGMAFAPDTAHLWVVVNQRDNVKYPYHDLDGRFGQVIPEYVDDNPPDELSRVEWGRNFGWPYCNPVPSESMDDLNYVPDAQNNPDNSVVECATFRRVDKGLSAHSVPLGLTFWQGDNVPVMFQNGALVAMHGSSSSTHRRSSGNKVVFIPWLNDRPGIPYDLVSGWLSSDGGENRWGQPVTTAVLPDGNVLITDDHSGTVYLLYQKTNFQVSTN